MGAVQTAKRRFTHFVAQLNITFLFQSGKVARCEFEQSVTEERVRAIPTLSLLEVHRQLHRWQPLLVKLCALVEGVAKAND